MSGDRTTHTHLVVSSMPGPSRTLVAGRDGRATDALPHLHFGPFRLALAERQLFRDGVPVQLGSRAFDLLAVLTLRAGEVIGNRELLQLVWPHAVVEQANLRVCVAALRKALGENSRQPRFVINVAGRGYTFAGAIDHSPKISGAFENPSAVATQRQRKPLQVLVSCNSAPEILSRLLSSPRFARMVGTGGGESRFSRADRVAAGASGERVDDASCFVFLGDPASTATDLEAGSAADGSPTDQDVVVVLDRCSRPGEVALSLAEGPLREAASIHFLTTNRDAPRFEQEYLPALAPATETGGTNCLVDVMKTIGVRAMAYHRWEREYGSLASDGMQRLHELEKENERLRKAVSDLTLEKLILKENAIATF